MEMETAFEKGQVVNVRLVDSLGTYYSKAVIREITPGGLLTRFMPVYLVSTSNWLGESITVSITSTDMFADWEMLGHFVVDKR